MAEALYAELRVLDLSPSGNTFTSGARVHCCNRMSLALGHTCSLHPDPYDCPDSLIAYAPTFDEYGLIIHDGGPSYLRITHCPWCGSRLPESKRDRYFDRLAELGLDDTPAENLPEHFKSDAWWQSAEPA